MKCPQCLNDNPEDALFCGLCGTSLGAYIAGVSTPQGMVSFPDAIRLGFQHYFDFRSRSTRAEYWWWFLFVVLADVILSVADTPGGTLVDWTGNRMSYSKGLRYANTADISFYSRVVENIERKVPEALVLENKVASRLERKVM